MIYKQTIDGRPASLAYMHADFTPASADAFALVKILFDDGEMLMLTNKDDAPADAESGAEATAFVRHRGRKMVAPVAEAEGAEESAAFARHRERHRQPIAEPNVALSDDAEPVPEKLQIVAWAKAIIVLDKSEILVRDLIERELAGVHLMPIARAIRTTDALMHKIKAIRESAIRLAFRLLRDRLGDEPILDKSLAAWASAFAQDDLAAIRQAIQTGLATGIDSTEIARKVVGSMALNGVDGITEMTRHKIAHLGVVAVRAARK